MERRWAAGALFTESEQEETHNVKDSIKKDPTKFQEIIDAREPEVKAAMQELSVKLDVIFSTAIKPSKIGCGGVTDAEARSIAKLEIRDTAIGKSMKLRYNTGMD